MVKIIEEKRHNVAIQAQVLIKRFPNSKCKVNRNGSLKWIGNLSPTEVSAIYKVRIHYVPPDSPKVYILEPKLVIPKNRTEIHLYNDDTLCLHVYGQWKQDMSIAESTIPWISEWLLYYEIWLRTGRWVGPA